MWTSSPLVKSPLTLARLASWLRPVWSCGSGDRHGCYQNSVLSVRATQTLHSGLSHTSSLWSHSSGGSYGDSQPWRRSRRRTSSGPSRRRPAPTTRRGRATPGRPKRREPRGVLWPPLRSPCFSHTLLCCFGDHGNGSVKLHGAYRYKHPVVTFKIKQEDDEWLFIYFKFFFKAITVTY